ncbi:MAG: 4Fe-4S binding protein [Pseudomonadota bacterium]
MKIPVSILRLRPLVQFAIFGIMCALPWIHAYGWPSFMQGVTGTFYAMHLGPIPFADPLGAVQVLLAGEFAAWPLWLGGLLALALAFVFGRVFCAWVCPYGMLSEWLWTLRGIIIKKPASETVPRYSDVKRAWLWRLVLTVLGLAITGFGAIPVLNSISAPALISLVPSMATTTTGAAISGAGITASGVAGSGLTSSGIAAAGATSVTWAVGAASIIMATLAFPILLLFIEAIIGRRFWCAYACPQSLLLMAASWVGAKLSSKLGAKLDWAIRVRWDTKACNCAVTARKNGESFIPATAPCVQVCSLNLQPRHKDGPDFAQCIQCGDCVKACAKHGKALVLK